MKKRFLAAGILLVFALLFFFFTGRQNASYRDFSRTITDYKLNTYVSVTIYDKDKEHVLEECMKLCDKYEMIFSRTNTESELYKLNHGLLPLSADGYYTISPELFEVISIGKKYASLSDNAFSIAMEPLTHLWNFTDGTSMIPSDSAIKEALPLVNSEDILLKEPSQIAFCKDTVYTSGEPVNHGMGLDLGAIAKGYIADKIKEYLLSENVDSALIYLGGNVLCIGDKPTKEEVLPFTVGIEKPFDVNSDAYALLKISNTSVVTSGTYQRYFENDGHLYHHILDSTTGYPHTNGLTSVTIITSSSTDADALSTTCFSLGLKKGLALLESLENADGFFITETGEYYYTDGFLEKYGVVFME